MYQNKGRKKKVSEGRRDGVEGREVVTQLSVTYRRWDGGEEMGMGGGDEDEDEDDDESVTCTF